MSLKENIDMVKEELNSEEKMFESAIKAENFYKKYRAPLFGLIAVIVVGVGANAMYQSSVEAKVEKANELFVSMEKNPTDEVIQNALKEINPELYQAWQFSQAQAKKDVKVLTDISNSKALAFSSIASYEVASLEKDTQKLESYTLKQDAIYKDLALLQSAYLLMKSEKIDDAHQKLQMISSESPLYKISQVLMHYGVK